MQGGKYKHAITMGVLLLINLLNFMDRFTIAGIHETIIKLFPNYLCIAVLDKIIKYFDISESYGGLLQTVFVCSYMILAPVFGYLG